MLCTAGAGQVAGGCLGDADTQCAQEASECQQCAQKISAVCGARVSSVQMKVYRKSAYGVHEVSAGRDRVSCTGAGQVAGGSLGDAPRIAAAGCQERHSKVEPSTGNIRVI